MKETSEHRKSVRFSIRGCTLVSLGSDYNRLGEVVDISLGGISFRCISGQEPSTNTGTLDIFCDDGLCLAEFPFQTVWDQEVADPAPFDYITTKRFGIRFGELENDQMIELRRLIQNHSTEDPEN